MNNNLGNNNEKYYYNGLFTDLCGMSVEDYINSTKLAITIANGNGGNGNGSIILPGGGNNTGGTNGDLNGGTTGVTPIIKQYVIYYDMIKNKEQNNITLNTVKSFKTVTASTNNEVTLTYFIPALTKDEYDFINDNETSDDELFAWEEENAYDKILVVPSIIFSTDSEKNGFSFKLDSVDALGIFKVLKTININNIEYTILIDEENNIINNKMEETKVGAYKFMLKE